MMATSPTESMDPSKELATTLLIPFIPRTCDELKVALECELPRKLPILPLDWNVLKVYNDVAAQVFECASSCSPVDITCILRATYFKCTQRYVFGEMESAEIRQAHWDAVFCNLWESLLELVEIDTSVWYSRDQSNSLSLKVYDKEIAFVEEDSGRKKTLVQALMKVRKIEPDFLQAYRCYALHSDGAHVLSGICIQFIYWKKLLRSDLKDIASTNGFATAVRTSVNMLRYALTWATTLNPLNLTKTMQEN